jgi:hypothetical protein
VNGDLLQLHDFFAFQKVVAGMNQDLRMQVEVNQMEREADVLVWRQLSGGHDLTS